MNTEIEIALISAVTSFGTSLLTISIDRYNQKRKSKKEELDKFVENSDALMREIIKISIDKEYFNVLNIRNALENNLQVLLTLPKKIGNLFMKLYELIQLQGSELKSKENEIRKLAKKIMKYIRKVGVEVSEFKK